MADSQEAEQPTLAAEDNASSETPAETKADEGLDVEAKDEVKESDEPQAAVEQSEADEPAADKAPDAPAEADTTEPAAEESQAAQPDEGGEQTEGTAEPSADEQKPADGDEQAAEAGDIPEVVTAPTDEVVEGETVEGEQVEGEQVEGEKPEGEKVEGEQVEGEKVEGEQVEGEKVEGEQVEGEKVEEQVEGEKAEGEQVEGEKPEGEQVEGEKPEGEQVEGEKPEGETVEGEKPEGEQVEGEKPEGEQAEGEKPEGEQAQEGQDTEGAMKEGDDAEGGGAAAVVAEEGGEAAVDAGEKDAAAVEDSQIPLPQSDTFDEGERPESPGIVGEKLSREPTPDKIDLGEALPGSLKPESPVDEYGTPLHPTVYEETEEGLEEGGGGAGDEEMAEEEEFDRDALVERYHTILAEREQLQAQNSQLQHKLADYFRKKKADERQDYDKNLTDQEQRYLKYMAQLEDLRRQDMQQRDHYQIQIEDHKEKCEEKRARVDEEREKFMVFKQEVALSAINTRSGKPIPPKDTEQYLSNENKKELEVVNVRLENIKLKNKLKKKEQQLKSKEELAEGLHLIDFEQLKIENQTYNEKIEERNEELLKLRKKITSTVQVLTHLKEKLQFVQGENHVQRGNLREVEALAAQKRDILSRTKQAHDSLRIDNQRLYVRPVDFLAMNRC
ncbi:coiled-coil domain-containing protein 96-like isoform X2 [Gigantopelta aegis]|uniref:coiled-coil domain-containing protein 96-like isoform X2 n=1 Tax=Gigantopelta aegis TaxID=1735272 RepID=UPI001B8883CA|nr:coiled-coil domain-containing protein 96-like isoform X2 [Gigantopelta aegis]